MGKEIVNIENLDAEKVVSLLEKKFNYPLQIAADGKLIIAGSFVKVYVKFKNTGNATEIKFATSKWLNGKIIAKIWFVPFYYIYATFKAFEEHKILVQNLASALRNCNQKTSESTDDISLKLSKLKEMKEQGILTEEEFNKKRALLIEKL